jgi:hypothetical protein
MNATFRLLLALLLFNMWAEAVANDNAIKLTCRYSYTIDENGRKSKTTGEDLLTVKPSKNGKTKIKKQGLPAEFHGTISDEAIVGETNYKIQGVTYHQELRIKRYTGEYAITFGILGKKSGLIHYGKCSAATEKLF